MRKLLVASQKGGVGKTTTSINLAAAAALGGTRVLLLDADPLSSVATTLNLASHAQRRTLRQLGLDLPGVLVCDVAPGLDVLSPYEAGPCSDDDLDDLLRVIDAPPFRASYGCMVVDAPPFLGANPTQLVGAVDGVVLVVRAEPLAHRTLPAFMQLVERSRGERSVRTHGVLVTLPDGEIPGGRWERELRGRLGGRALAQVIPFDGEVSQASESGRIAAEVRPDGPAAVQYHRLAEALKLADDPLPLKKAPGAAPLLAAAAALLEPVGATARGSVCGVASAPAAPLPEGLEEAPEIELPPDLGAAELDLPSFAGLSSVSPPSLTLPAFRPTPAAVVRLETKPTGPEDRSPAAPTPAASQGSALPWIFGIGLAAAAGVGLRFIQLPDYMLPVAVGVAVAAAVILAMHLLLSKPEAPRKAPSVAAALPTKAPKMENAAGRKDVANRLSDLARASGSYRRPRRR